jgi:hypothetical protein
MADESKFPTILDLRDALSRLIELGVGQFPVQVLIAPGSTMVAVAKVTGAPMAAHDNRPPLMIEFDGAQGRIGPSLVSTEYLEGSPATREH